MQSTLLWTILKFKKFNLGYTSLHLFNPDAEDQLVGKKLNSLKLNKQASEQKHPKNKKVDDIQTMILFYRSRGLQLPQQPSSTTPTPTPTSSSTTTARKKIWIFPLRVSKNIWTTKSQNQSSHPPRRHMRVEKHWFIDLSDLGSNPANRYTLLKSKILLFVFQRGYEEL